MMVMNYNPREQKEEFMNPYRYKYIYEMKWKALSYRIILKLGKRVCVRESTHANKTSRENYNNWWNSVRESLNAVC